MDVQIQVKGCVRSAHLAQLWETRFMKPRNAGQSTISTIIQGTIMRTLLSTEITSRKFRMLGEVADYKIWLGKAFGKVRVSNRREIVWSKMSKTLDGKEFVAVELGVAWGFLTW